MGLIQQNFSNLYFLMIPTSSFVIIFISEELILLAVGLGFSSGKTFFEIFLLHVSPSFQFFQQLNQKGHHHLLNSYQDIEKFLGMLSIANIFLLLTWMFSY